MERIVNNPLTLVEAPMGTWVREVGHTTPVMERVLGGWKEVDEWGNPTGSVYEHYYLRLPVQVLRAGYGEATA